MIEVMRDRLDKLSIAATNWIGTPTSLVVHTVLFAGAFAFTYLGISLDDILLVLTTIVSLEAIYLAIFIQMTVNRHAERIEEVGEDIEDIQEEVQDLGEDVEEISEDVEEISEDIEKMQEEQAAEEEQPAATLENIQAVLYKLVQDTEILKSRTHHLRPADEESHNGATNATSAETMNYFKKFMGLITFRGKSGNGSATMESEIRHE
ncbi:MAG: hypothetical protein RL681_750 [Candidatus Parcubacteria bacterium]|jgi:uncharacterized protein YoxC